MKICIPTEEKNGLESRAYGHFGSAPYFLIYDTLNKEFEYLNNSDSNHEHGKCNPIQPLIDKGVDIVVVEGMGANALMKLIRSGIQVFRIIGSENIREIITGLDIKKMEKLTVENSCKNHN